MDFEAETAQKEINAFKTALNRAQPIGKRSKYLLKHEKQLLADGLLHNITHRGAKAVWLSSLSNTPRDGETIVYRHMGDTEALYLLEHGILPDTQPYQAIMVGAVGRWYADKYLKGIKWTDTHPSTIVEFTCPAKLIETLEAIQTKIEDGTMSMGLGCKAGGGLPLFNSGLRDGEVTYRVVKVKRVQPTAGSPIHDKRYQKKT